MSAPAQSIGHLLRTLFELFTNPGFDLMLAIVMSFLVNQIWRRYWQNRAAQSWSQVQAVIDIASVVERMDSDKTIGYAAVLTYFYRYPELETGDYERIFPLEATAREWAQQFKGRHVAVRVNPGRPSESILLESDLQTITSHEPANVEEAMRLEPVPLLPSSYGMLSATAQFASYTGLTVSAILLWVNLASGNATAHWGMIFLAVALLIESGASSWIILHKFEDASGSKSFWSGYLLWCPPWMRWSIQWSGLLMSLFLLIMRIRALLPESVRDALHLVAPHIPYILGCWAFLSLAGFHAAIIRSQEQARTPGRASLDPSE